MAQKGAGASAICAAELLVSAVDALPKVEAEKIGAPVSLGCVCDLTEDAGEATYGMMWTATA